MTDKFMCCRGIDQKSNITGKDCAPISRLASGVCVNEKCLNYGSCSICENNSLKRYGEQCFEICKYYTNHVLYATTFNPLSHIDVDELMDEYVKKMGESNE